MGMKDPKGKPQKIGGTVSSPKDATCYEKMGNAATSAHPVDGPKNIGNSSMPKPTSSGTSKTY